MDGVEWLESFYETIEGDPRIGTTHISVYLALVYESFKAGYAVNIVLDRPAIMKRAKINSPTTYNRSLHELHEFGYVEYLPVAGMGRSCVRLRKI
jgi:hypothetical protein